ncbi:TetR/AcrR family transcriptional regulator [Saccharothrix coeruleofusca]|uniref:TetR family transcriptional regulator n=1 Tax=Saccharothrix coeruleofusca TaxID=33919 RepID=A0A918ART8_9PSEU|nr:TetR/AcrR family transcriptional regulator [Saccharothrix coeruleofusca]GGP76795.1 TetR family transcriptional regulator [Saccharothrix coeruleofusca]
MTRAEHSATSPKRVRRADAERNRAAIIEAAAGVLAEQGCTVDVREIAQRSGVGMGTLYRHFPTKEDLLGTVLEREFATWTSEARQAATATEDPRAALEEFFEQALVNQAHHRAVVERYCENWRHPAQTCGQPLVRIIDELRERAQRAGKLRPDITTDDLALLLAALSQTVQMTPVDKPWLWRRQLRVCLDGLNCEHAAPLPVAERH